MTDHPPLRRSSPFHAPRAQRRRALLATSAVAILALSSDFPVRAQGPATRLFVPGDHVPLSQFVEKTGTVATMHVQPEILEWIDDQSGAVEVSLRKASGQIQYYAATTVNLETGVVTLSSIVMGDCVVVTDLLLQDLDISTHWDSTLDPDGPSGPAQDRGGFALGATDGLGSIDVSSTEDELVSAGGPGNHDPTWGDSGGEYVYASNLYAVFSDGTSVNDAATVPAYERYVGEVFSTVAPTPLAAIWLSDDVRERTGFPVAHRSHPRALDSTAGAGEQLADDLPLFQLVHAYTVAFDGVTPTGENSLATLVLPPGWTSEAAADSYPILFNGFYDLHEATFLGVGPAMLGTLGDLYAHAEGPRRVVGLIWNGGGSAATYTTHASAYANAAQLIADAADLLSADPDRIVFSGGSRGGLTALEIGSNPYDHPYTARFVNSYVPFPRMGSTVEGATFTHALGLDPSFGYVTGWKTSWQTSWTEPGTGLSGWEVVLRNLYGTTDPDEVDEDFSVDSDTFVEGLVEQATGVVIRLGTHDSHRASAYVVEYVDELVAADVDVQLEIFYRAGHGVPLDTAPLDADLLNMLFDEEELSTAVRHYKRVSTDPRAFAEIAPAYVPLVYETAFKVATGQQHLWSFFGEPGGRFQVQTAYVGWSWTEGDGWPTTFGVAYNGYLTAPSGALFGTATLMRQYAATPGIWLYQVLYSPDGDTSYDYIVGEGAFSHPTATMPGVGVVATVPGNLVGTLVGSLCGGVAQDHAFTPIP